MSATGWRNTLGNEIGNSHFIFIRVIYDIKIEISHLCRCLSKPSISIWFAFLSLSIVRLFVCFQCSPTSYWFLSYIEWWSWFNSFMELNLCYSCLILRMKKKIIIKIQSFVVWCTHSQPILFGFNLKFIVAYVQQMRISKKNSRQCRRRCNEK